MSKPPAPRSADFGERLRRLRKAKGMTQQDVADHVGCTQRAMVYYEKNGKIPPSAISAKMAALFGVTIEALIDHADAEPPPAAAPDLLDSAEDRRLWRHFKQLRQLPERDQAAVIRMLSSMAQAKKPAPARA